MEEAYISIRLQDYDEKVEATEMKDFEATLIEAVAKVTKRLYIIGYFSEHFSNLKVSQLNKILTLWYCHIERILNLTSCLVEVDILISGPGFPAIKLEELTNLTPKFTPPLSIEGKAREDGDLMKFDVGVLGGTFDHLHSGHKVMLTVAAMVCAKTLHIGISGEPLLKKKKHGDWLQDFETRKERLLGFVSSVNPALTVVTAELQDMYGPSLLPECQILIVSEETRKGGEVVNAERLRLGRRPCEVVVIDLVASEKAAGKTSSTTLREFAKVKSWLEDQWDGLCRNLKIDKDVSKAWSTRLIRAYSEPQRHYHTIFHVNAMLRLLVLHSDKCQQPTVLHMATWFHDCVYDPRTKDNELQSALLFREFVKEANCSGLDEITDLVDEYIKATIKHTMGESEDTDLALFLDLDLSILGSDPSSYETYSTQIRSEYLHIPWEVYKVERSKVLKHFLERKVLFFTKQFQKDLEEVARANLAKEIDKLQQAS